MVNMWFGAGVDTYLGAAIIGQRARYLRNQNGARRGLEGVPHCRALKPTTVSNNDAKRHARSDVKHNASHQIKPFHFIFFF